MERIVKIEDIQELWNKMEIMDRRLSKLQDEHLKLLKRFEGHELREGAI